MRFLWFFFIATVVGQLTDVCRTCESPLPWRCSRGVGGQSSETRACVRACRGSRSGREPFRARRALHT
jgi:hypothetical protein